MSSPPSKLIESNEDFHTYEIIVENHKQLSRIWTNGTYEIKLTNELAKSLGFESLKNLFDQIPGFKDNLLKTYKKIPKWIRVETSKFIVRPNESKSSLN